MVKTDEVLIIICDAGPIIHLDEIGSLSLLSNNSDILIPEVVWAEVNQHRPQAIETCNKIAKMITPKQVSYFKTTQTAPCKSYSCTLVDTARDSGTNGKKNKQE